jgi:hypothetical protein
LVEELEQNIRAISGVGPFEVGEGDAGERSIEPSEEEDLVLEEQLF